MDGVGVAGERVQEFSGAGIPETHSSIVAAASDQCAVSIEGNRGDAAAMSSEHGNTVCGIDIPESDCLIGTATDQ